MFNLCRSFLHPTGESMHLRDGIFGDIHGNHDALDAVLEVLEQEKVDTYLCTGDVVGYGAEPSKCIKTVRDKCIICLAGNHDHAACGKLDTEFFNVFAKQVAHWTQTHLSDEEKTWLAGLPFVCHFEDFTLAHGSAHSPEVFNYITTIFDFFFNDTATTEIYTLSLHDALPISPAPSTGATASSAPSCGPAPLVRCG